MKRYEVRWQDRGGFPGGLALTFEAADNAEALRRFAEHVDGLRDRNINQRLGHCGLALHSPSGARLKFVNWGM